jgi:hypothetical protein
MFDVKEDRLLCYSTLGVMGVRSAYYWILGVVDNQRVADMNEMAIRNGVMSYMGILPH